MAIPLTATHSLDGLNLAPGVRLHWSAVRQQHWLLFPEGALALNASATAILTYCDGQHGVNDMVKALQRQFQGVNVNEIQELLAYLMDRGLLRKAIQP
jgi:pyrroloquinoline quinone biosynthesis protein D